MSWIVSMWLACASPPLASQPAPQPAEEPVPAVPKNLPEPTEPRYAATHVLISWQGAPRSTAKRSEPEAEALARDLHAQAVAGADLDALAKAHSDGPSGPRGGSLGVYATGTMVPTFERAIASVGVGAIAPLIRTPFGWHVARRDAVTEAKAAQVLVSWKGAWRSKATRSKDEAKTRILAAQAALGNGTPFPDVAKTYSDGAAAAKGGKLGRVAPGQFLPDFEVALFALEPDGVSDIVETDYGFHLIHRLP